MEFECILRFQDMSDEITNVKTSISITIYLQYISIQYKSMEFGAYIVNDIDTKMSFVLKVL